MDILNYFKVLLALIFVIMLIALLGFAAKKLDFVKKKLEEKSSKRLKLIDSLWLDNHKKLILIKRDNVEHLILVSKTNDIVIETGIISKGEIAN